MLQLKQRNLDDLYAAVHNVLNYTDMVPLLPFIRNWPAYDLVQFGEFATPNLQAAEYTTFYNWGGYKLKVDKAHNLEHAATVCLHVQAALVARSYINEPSYPIGTLGAYDRKTEDRYGLSHEQYYNLLFAALLHDFSDKKFYPEQKNHENVREVCKALPAERVDEIIMIISYVSCSENGDNWPTKDGKPVPEEELYVRWADRLTAVGAIGLERCLEYTLHKKLPLYLPTTIKVKQFIAPGVEKYPDHTFAPEFKSEAEWLQMMWKTEGNPPKEFPFETTSWQNINEVATAARYAAYTQGGGSVSLIDHIYDKLWHLGSVPSNNPYFKKQFANSLNPLSDVVRLFSAQGHITEEEIKNIILKHNHKQDTLTQINLHK